MVARRVASQLCHRPGVSVLVATSCGAGRIEAALNSLREQDFPADLLELVVVENGDQDGTESLVDEFRRKTDISVTYRHIPERCLGRARNVAVELAQRAHILVLDDDDYLESRYIKSLFLRSSSHSIVVGRLVDQEIENGEISTETNANKLRETIGESGCLLSALPWVLSLNAAKLIPTNVAKACQYPEHLKSGEDVAYMAQLLRYPLLLRRSVNCEGNAYVRVLRPESVSRQRAGFSYSVLQRLDVISELYTTYSVVEDRQSAYAVRKLARSQETVAVDYLLDRASAQEEQETRNEIQRRGIPAEFAPRLARLLNDLM